MEEEEIKKILFKRAMGYEAQDVIEEYNISDGEEVLCKKKVTRKYYPPDLSALKILVERFYPNIDVDLSELSDEELYAERENILNLYAKEDGYNEN